MDMQQEGAQIVVKGKLPVGEMFGPFFRFEECDRGQRQLLCIRPSFEKLPEELQPKIIGQIRSRKGLKGSEEENSE